MGSGFFSSWTFWALLSAAFAAMTAIFAKIGIENVNSDFATLLRTIVVLVSLALILYATGQYQSLGSISAKSYLFLLLSGLATGASWICYLDKLSVVLVAVLGVVLLGEKLDLRQWGGIGLITAGVVMLALRR
jgi:transporter family protein